MTDRDWIIATYDELVAAHADAGVPLDEVRSEFQEAYAVALTGGNVMPPVLDDLEIGGILFDRVIRPARTQRRASLKQNAGYLGSILIGDADTEGVDPVLALAFPLGDGKDKTLRLWTKDDWRDSSLGRFRGAADQTAAAAEFDRAIQPILDAFDQHPGIAYTRDLFAGVVAS